jgi:dihydroorotate dehydrogenase
MPLYKNIIAPLLFTQDAEKVHHWITALLEKGFSNALASFFLKKVYSPKVYPDLKQKIWGIDFQHPIGLAAGFDKDAKLIKPLSNLGFSFIEIGTLTPVAQPGNERPRLFRLKDDQALINRMGFNNGGVADSIERLKKKGNIIVGGNIGKNKVTPNDKAVEDYLKCFNALYPYVDYFVLNVSSPNTPGLRALQDKEPLRELIQTVQKANNSQSKPKPILLKIAPDLSTFELDDIVEVLQLCRLDGVIATNTTVDRSGLTASKQKIDTIGLGGLSGRPVANRSTEIIKYLREKLGPEPIIIGVGGVFNGRDAIQKLHAGANLIQAYTGFIYEGPKYIKKALQEMDYGLKSGHWTWKNRRI